MLKKEIENYLASIQEKNALFIKANAGTLTVSEVAVYVRNLAYLSRATALFTERGACGARDRGWEGLARFYEEKKIEEAGHDEWARQDLERLLHGKPNLNEWEPAPPIKELVHYLLEVIDGDPRLFLAYALLVELVTVVAGPLLLKSIERNCGIPASSISAVGNHVDADRAHVSADLDAIDQFAGLPDTEQASLDVIHRSIDHLERFCRYVVECEHRIN